MLSRVTDVGFGYGTGTAAGMCTIDMASPLNSGVAGQVPPSGAIIAYPYPGSTVAHGTFRVSNEVPRVPNTLLPNATAGTPVLVGLRNQDYVAGGVATVTQLTLATAGGVAVPAIVLADSAIQGSGLQADTELSVNSGTGLAVLVPINPLAPGTYTVTLHAEHQRRAGAGADHLVVHGLGALTRRSCRTLSRWTSSQRRKRRNRVDVHAALARTSSRRSAPRPGSCGTSRGRRARAAAGAARRPCPQFRARRCSGRSFPRVRAWWTPDAAGCPRCPCQGVVAAHDQHGQIEGHCRFFEGTDLRADIGAHAQGHAVAQHDHASKAGAAALFEGRRRPATSARAAQAQRLVDGGDCEGAGCQHGRAAACRAHARLRARPGRGHAASRRATCTVVTIPQSAARPTTA